MHSRVHLCVPRDAAQEIRRNNRGEKETRAAGKTGGGIEGRRWILSTGLRYVPAIYIYIYIYLLKPCIFLEHKAFGIYSQNIILEFL